MADDVKVYIPTVVEESPFPQENQVGFSATQGSGEVLSPTSIKDKPPPLRRTALELIASSLNTQSRKILQEFQFTQQGALQIGKYENGISGDMRISPSGIVARNQAGILTFTLDGDTGDATFAGTLRAGSTIVANSIVNEESSSGEGRTVYYNGGIPAIVIGDAS